MVAHRTGAEAAIKRLTGFARAQEAAARSTISFPAITLPAVIPPAGSPGSDPASQVPQAAGTETPGNTGHPMSAIPPGAACPVATPGQHRIPPAVLAGAADDSEWWCQ